MSASVHTGELPPIGVITPIAEIPETSDQPTPLLRPRERPLSEQSSAVLLGRVGRLEGALGAARSILRRCIIERKTPTREALAAEAGFALGMAPDAALAELDEIAQIVGVSSLR